MKNKNKRSNITGRTPIFKPENRDAIREGRKTETRRVIKPQPIGIVATKHRYGKPGDLRVLREPLCKKADGSACYADDGADVITANTGEPVKWRWQRDALSSMFMPANCGRTVLRYTDIHAERLHAITEMGAIAEGVGYEQVGAGTLYRDYQGAENSYRSDGAEWFQNLVKNQPGYVLPGRIARRSFRSLWDSINAARGFRWVDNPWVWVIKWEMTQ